MNYLKQIPRYLSADEVIDYNRLIIKKIREGSCSDEEIKMWLRYEITKRFKQIKIIISEDKDLKEQIEQHRKLLEAIERL